MVGSLRWLGAALSGLSLITGTGVVGGTVAGGSRIRAGAASCVVRHPLTGVPAGERGARGAVVYRHR